MGDAADWQIENDINRALSLGFERKIRRTTRRENRERIARITWTMRDGTTIKVADMTLRHLGNVVRLVERRGQENAHMFRDYYENRLKAEPPNDR